MKNRLSRLCILFFLLCTVCLSSCNRLSGIADSEQKEKLPDMVMTKAVYSFGEKGRKPVVMKADRITIYNRETDRTELENITFNQDDELTGSCDNAVVTGNNSRAELSGNIRLFKKTDNYTIMCDNLVWDNESQIISTEGIVDIQYEDGTKIKAMGFTALLNENSYEFRQIIEGSYESDK